MAAVDPKRLRELSWTRTELSEIAPPEAASVFDHGGDPLERFKGSKQDRGGFPVRTGDDVDHPVAPVCEVDVQVAGGSEHRSVPCCLAPGSMAGRVARFVGFGFRDPTSESLTAGKFPDEHTTQEVRGHLDRRTPEERRGESSPAHGPVLGRLLAKKRSSLPRGQAFTTSCALTHPRCATPMP